MTWIDESIRQYGRTIGAQNLSLSEQGLLCLDFERKGRLQMELVEGALLIYLSRHLPGYDREKTSQVLEACSHQRHHPFPLHAALKDDTLFVLARIPERDVTPPVLEQCIKLLESVA